jgi:hypothetical protein
MSILTHRSILKPADLSELHLVTKIFNTVRLCLFGLNFRTISLITTIFTEEIINLPQLERENRP